MNVDAVVVAGGRRGGTDVLAPVAGVPLLVRAVRGLLDSGLVDHVVLLLDAQERRESFSHACAGLPVSVHAGSPRELVRVRAHAAQRAGTAQGDGGMTLVHDAARALAPASLATAVVDAVRAGHDVAVPVLPLTDTVKQVHADGTVHTGPDRAGLRVLQTPFAVRTEMIRTDDDLLAIPTTRAAHTVAGHPLAFAVRTAWDLEMAELLVTSDFTEGARP